MNLVALNHSKGKRIEGIKETKLYNSGMDQKTKRVNR